MNARRDLEQAITSWLGDEAASPAPDRVLESARHAVYRTNQRRFAAISSQPLFRPLRFVALAATLIVVVGAAIGLGPGSFWTAPAPTASTVPGVTLEAYRNARNDICNAYHAVFNPLKAKLDRIYDPTLPAADRAIAVQALSDIAAQHDLLIAELDALAVPAEIAEDHAAQLADYRATISLIRQEFPRIASGDYVGAEALDAATSPHSRAIEAFESKYSLASCP